MAGLRHVVHLFRRRRGSQPDAQGRPIVSEERLIVPGFLGPAREDEMLQANTRGEQADAAVVLTVPVEIGDEVEVSGRRWRVIGVSDWPGTRYLRAVVRRVEPHG